MPALVRVVEPVAVRSVSERPVPCPWVNKKFWRVDEAVVEVAVIQPTVGEDEADIAPVPLPYKKPPLENDAAPVPPTLTVRVDDEVRSVGLVQTAGRPAEPEPVKLEPPTQVPLAKVRQPVVRLIPLANVDVPVPPTFTMPLV